jgi:glutamyl-tRNA synthetase
MTATTTRLAPSPTGALHLGNARTFLVNVLLARQRGWRVLFRMEDLDTPRTRPGADRQALEVLGYLGLSWEEPVVYQSAQAERHDAALERLARAAQAYPCICTRKEIELAASAPAEDDPREGAYPGTCRGRFASAAEARQQTGRDAAWRVRTDGSPIQCHDELAGLVSFDLARTTGDFVIYRKAGMAAYQLAVIVDDHDAGVDAIVRGRDLLESTAMQTHLRRLLGYDEPVDYVHVPLVIGPDGRKLAKRHGDTRLIRYLRQGCPPERLLGLLGWWCGVLDRPGEIDLDALTARFDLDRLPREPIVFTPQDDDFLLGQESKGNQRPAEPSGREG